MADDDPDETEGRKLYRARANTLANTQVNMAKRKVKYGADRATVLLDYEIIRREHPQLPAFEDLTEEQCRKIEAEYIRNHQWFDKLGDAIRNGGPLPDWKE